jgi:hypothetical protein
LASHSHFKLPKNRSNHIVITMTSAAARVIE